ncbi:MAG: hypothetical protein N3B21_04960 [Clostridia bacterium]|nr:hypothetical protein [Clostridia bacterium]
MSLFLGKVHYWLYNKILWFEGLEENIVQWAKNQGLPIESWLQSIYNRFGAPTGDKPLEQIIDTSNIHGWLQDRIESAELRQAALVTEILNNNSQFKGALTEIFTKQGESAAREYGTTANTPEEVYNALNNFILEGMPCDRVNEIISDDDNEFVWETTTCLHRPHWERVQGNVENFYDLRKAWVEAFVSTLNPAFRYEKHADGVNKIIRQ